MPIEIYWVLGILLTALLAAFFGSLIPRKLKEREKFIEAANDFRNAFRQEISFLKYNTAIKGTQSTDCSVSQFLKTGGVHRHTESLVSFKKHLTPFQGRSIDKAWQEYQKQIDGYKSSPMSEKDKQEALQIIETFLNKHAKTS